MDIVSGVRRLFPDVTAAVEQYRQAKPDREARNLARRLANEEVLYDQFIRKLSLLQSAVSTKGEDGLLRGIESRFGPEIAVELTSDLRQMEEFLRGLKADLANTSRGTEVLAKFRRTTPVSRGGLPKTTLQKRLDGLSRMNKHLTAYLFHGQIPLALETNSQTILDFKLLLDQQGGELRRSLQVTSERRGCDCEEVVTRSVVNDKNLSSTPDVDVPLNRQAYKESVVSLQQRFQHISVQSFKDSKDSDPFVQGACCSAAEDQGGESYYPSFAKRERGNEPFRLTIRPANLPATAISFENLVLRRGMRFDQRRRMELAFRLSSAVLLLWTSPLLIGNPRWNDWVVLFDSEQGDEPSSLYLIPNSHSDGDFLDEKLISGASSSILGREPVLALLGLRLIELAFGRTFKEIRQDEVNLLQIEEDDQHLRDLMTAKRLLGLHRIAEEFGKRFEDVVNVCITQQYRQRKDACVAELSLQDTLVLERAAVTILLPLYQEAHRYSGCSCNGTSPSLAEHTVVKKKDPPKDGEENRKDGDILASHTPGQLLSEQTPKLGDVVNSEAFQASSNLTHPSTSLPQLLIHDTSQPISSKDPALRGQKHVIVDPGSDSRNINIGGLDSQRSYEELVDPSYQLTPETGSLDVKRRLDGTEGAVHRIQDSVMRSSLENETRHPEKTQNVCDTSFEHEKSTQNLTSRPFDVDSATVSSYEAITATTDSAFPWLSDHTDEPPEISENHPLLLLKGIVLRISLIAFQAWREHVGGANEPSEPTTREDASKKRTRAEPEENQDNEEDDEDEEGGESSRQSLGVSNKKRRVNNRTFSCPFFKKDAFAYHHCCTYVLKRIRDVKQHLGRRHPMPIYCPRCIQTFSNEDDRDTHVREVDCERVPRAKPEGITESQRRQLARKAPANQSSEQQWYGIFDILFPDHESRPESPYIDSELFRNVFAFQSFLSSRGPQILGSVLTARGAVTLNPPAGESDVQAFLHRVLEDGIQTIIDQWAGSRGNSTTETNTMNPSTRSPGRVIEHRMPEPQRNEAVSGPEVGEQYSATTSSSFTAPSSSYVSSSFSFDREGEWPLHLNLDNITGTWGGQIPSVDDEEFQRILDHVGLQTQNMDFQ